MTTDINPDYADALYENLANGTAVPSGDRWLALATDGLFTEESGDGRQAISGGVMGTSTGGDGTSTSTVTFTGLPSDTYTHWMIFDDETAGNYVVRGSLLSPKIVTLGSLDIAAGHLGLNIDAG